MIIYKVIESGKIVYIGQTTGTLKDRIKGHLYVARYSEVKYPFARAIHINGIDTFEFVKIDSAKTLKELNGLERYYIKHYDTINTGYNVRCGGDNKWHTKETKNKIGNAQKGELNHMYGITGKENPTSIKVINLITGSTYNSVTECSENESQNLSKIASVCRGEREGLNGMVYRYIDEDGYIVHLPNEKLPKTLPVLNKTKNKLYSSRSKASVDMGKSRGYISSQNPPHREAILINNQLIVTL